MAMTNKGKRVAIASLLVLVIVAGVVAIVILRSDNKLVNKPVVAPQQADKSEASTPPEPKKPEQPTEQTKLRAVGNYTGSGTATRTTSGKFIHTVSAKLNDPAKGKFYEGWLVNAPDFFSTGKLVKNADNTWSLTYTSDSPKLNYRQVVITEETTANGLDNVPEAHMLEGTF